MPFIAMRRDHQFFSRAEDQCANLALSVAKLNPEIDDPDDQRPGAKDKSLDRMGRFRFPSESLKAYKQSFERWKAAIQSRRDSEIFEIEAGTRVLLGTGNASVFEFGFNLNHPWGVPYISGSSLKGLVSAYLGRHGGEDWRRKSGTAVKSDAQVELFGGVREKQEKDKGSYVGALIFHDAWLSTWPEQGSRDKGHWFDADIITTHHGKYYSGKRLPDGTENPIPIKIAALRPGLIFLVCIQGPEEYRVFARKILLEALEEEGIGGKTAVGYGRFVYVKTPEEEIREIKEKIEKAESAAELQALFNKHKNNTAFAGPFKAALSRIGYSDETEEMFKALRPLAYLKKMVELGKIEDLKTLNQRFKNLKSQMEKFLESEAADALKKTGDGRSLFDLMMDKWAAQLKQSPELGVVKALAYDWEDLGVSGDELLVIVEDKKWVWPPVQDLPAYLENHSDKFDADTREIILLALKPR